MVALSYNPNTGRYVDAETGRPLRRSEVSQRRDEIVERLKNELRLLGVLYASGEIDLQQLQARMAVAIKQAHLQAAGLAAGGMNRLTPVHYRDVNQRLEEEFVIFLLAFGDQIEREFFSNERLIARTQAYARSVARSFSGAEKITRIQDGANEALRMLDPNAKHCEACPEYDTQGKWVPATEIVPVGERCPCGGNCKCTVFYRFNPNALSDRFVE